MAYKCSWCEQTKDAPPAGSFTPVFDGREPCLMTGAPNRGSPKFVEIKGNNSLCETCMTNPACTGEAMVKRIRAARVALTQEKQT